MADIHSGITSLFVLLALWMAVSAERFALVDVQMNEPVGIIRDWKQEELDFVLGRVQVILQLSTSRVAAMGLMGPNDTLKSFPLSCGTFLQCLTALGSLSAQTTGGATPLALVGPITEYNVILASGLNILSIQFTSASGVGVQPPFCAVIATGRPRDQWWP